MSRISRPFSRSVIAGDEVADRTRSAIHVCSLSALADTVAASRARHVMTLINPETFPDTPQGVHPDRHLKIGMHDIVEVVDGMVAPSDEHVVELLEFVGAWDRQAPLVVHCWAGISRSTAAAFITACAVVPAASETDIAARLRQLSVTATPNRRLVSLADDVLGRQGRMVDAVDAIGPGRASPIGVPFVLDLFDLHSDV